MVVEPLGALEGVRPEDLLPVEAVTGAVGFMEYVGGPIR